jgi:hypothetical protein
MTARRDQDTARRVAISFVIPGTRPLDVFAGKVSTAIADLLCNAGIDLHCSAVAKMPAEHRLIFRRPGIERHPDRTITVPRLTGPDVRGIPGAPIHRFLRIDQRRRVLGTDSHVFAADYPVKHGGLSTKQADTATDGIAHRAGLAPPSAPLHPVVPRKEARGLRTPLLTEGRQDRRCRAGLLPAGAHERSATATEPFVCIAHRRTWFVGLERAAFAARRTDCRR